MAIRSGFFNSLGHDRRYGSADWADVFGLLVGNGVFSGKGDNLMVEAGENMTVHVKSGAGWILGYWMVNSQGYPLTLANASGILPRIDRVVMRLDMTARAISLAVLTGTPGASPVAPALTRDGTVYELCLAEIAVAAGATAITQAQITDKRAVKEVCGWVSGLIDQYDATGLFAQFQTAFEVWFEHVKNQLSSDIAGNLQNQIDEVNRKLSSAIGLQTISSICTLV